MTQILRIGSSQYSRSISHYVSSDVEELTDEDLIKKVNHLKNQVRILSIENEILEKSIIRLEPSLLNGVQQAIDYAAKLQSGSSLQVSSFVKSQTSKFGLTDSTSRSRVIASVSRISTRRIESSPKLSGTVIIGLGPRINVIERSELVSTEMEVLVLMLESERNKSAKQQALLKAQLEEIKVRVADIDKATEEFNEKVVVDGWDKISQRIPAEIWIRFMTEWVKTCDSHIGKFRLRTCTLNTQYSKFKRQIKVKSELSESLRPVDFEELKILNKECLKMIDRKIDQLVLLKKLTGDANLNLAEHKKALMDQNGYLTSVIKGINVKKRMSKVLDRERDGIAHQVDGLASTLEELRAMRMSYQVPDIMDYVKVKSDLADLKHSIKLLENNVRIKHTALKSLNKRIQSLCVDE